jgi:hypothetical protein
MRPHSRALGAVVLLFALATFSLPAQAPELRELVDLANRDRAAAGLNPLTWDPALAAAAYAHALRMVQEGPISHRYGGEPDLAERAAASGARFSLIEENIAIGQSPAQVHSAWMHSPGHHDNLLNPQIDRIGVALVPARGVLYAVADYAQSVPVLSAAQVEAEVASVVRNYGLALRTDPSAVSLARQYCAMEEGEPVRSNQPGVADPNFANPNRAEPRPRFLMRWQSAQVSQLPTSLTGQMASGRYRAAAVGACPAESGSEADQAAFTAYRAAVLLY